MLDRSLLLPLGQLNTTPATGPGIAVEHAGPGTATGAAASGTATGGAGTAAVATTTITTTSTAPGSATQAATQAAPPDTLSKLMIPMLLVLGALWIFTMRGKNKDEKRRKSLLADLKKGDKVMTIGGMVANVVSVDGEEVVLKIDESANVKARYRKSAIQEVLTAEEKEKK